MKMRVQFENKEIENIYNEFEKISLRAIESEHPDKIHIHGYFSFREKVRNMMGTGNNLEGISELLFFLHIKKRLETIFGKGNEFQGIRPKKVFPPCHSAYCPN